jgi:thioesterase domain-containing protein/acyl carrier protein
MEHKHVESIYPLSPSQQGMLFETLSAPEPGIHVEQFVWSLRGDLDLAAFERAWQRVVERHTILRTCFVWQDQDEPLQVVLRRVRVPLQRQDWRGLAPSQQQERLEAHLKADRRRGFAPGRAPLMRLTLFLTGDESYQVAWTFHHILMDGWSAFVVAQQVLTSFQAFSNGQDLKLEPSRPYRDYVRWLKQQDLAQAQAFWAQQLAGFSRPTPLGLRAAPDDSSALPGRYGEQTACLPASTTATLQSLAQQHQLTLSTLVQGVWALLLSRYSGEADVVFGATVSGRPPDLTGMESMVGAFINTVPMRFEISPSSPLWSWLEVLQAHKLAQQRYEYCSSGQIRQWVEASPSTPLYESILVFENYPLDTSPLQQPGQTVDVHDVHYVGAQTNYALTMLVFPGVQLRIGVIYDHRRFDAPDVARILEHWLAVLESIAALDDPRLDTLLSGIPDEQVPRVKPLRKHTPDRLQGRFVPPRNALERRLAQVWEEVLGTPLIGIHDNFFELGGHSLLAVRLMARIRQAFGKNLPLAALFRGATIEQFADVLRQQSDAWLWSPLVPIQPQGKKRPFFCVPGMGGNPIYLHELARHLGSDQPFYGLQSVGLDGESEPYTRVEDIAAHYIKVVQTVQAHGPYVLGGHSFGGSVAFEMAQQWQRQGEQVALVVIFDTSPKLESDPARLAWDDAQWLVYIAGLVEHLLEKALGVSYKVLQPLEPDEQLRYFGERLQAEDWLPPGEVGITQLRGLVRVFRANNNTQYAPQDVRPTRIALFRASEPSLEEKGITLSGTTEEPDLSWGEFAENKVKVYDVPGNHLTMMVEPYVQMLAERLRACLEEVEERHQTQIVPE